MNRLLIVDDHAIVRRGLREILDDVAGIELRCDEAPSGEEALVRAAAAQYALVLLDISMPDRNGLETLKRLKRDHPSLPVLMLSMHPEEQYAIRALKAGAAGYLTKQSAPDELIAAVTKVLAGGKYVSASLSERLAEELTGGRGETAPHERLSDREYQLVCMLAAGRTLKEIADELSLSIKTISTYRARILEKMRLRNNAEIINYAIRHNLV